MNRLQFLKTLGVGIAAAVITPKLLTEKPPLSLDITTAGEIDPDAFQYAHYEEDFPKYTINDLRIHDLCVDKDARVWMCTAMWPDKVELTALEADPEPNFFEVRKKNFDEYFFILVIDSAWPRSNELIRNRKF